MLPTSLLEKVLNCHGLRTWPLRGEKRRTPRIPLRRRVLVHVLNRRTIGQPLLAWTRDISLHGTGVMVSGKVGQGNEFIINLLPSAHATNQAARSGNTIARAPKPLRPSVISDDFTSPGRLGSRNVQIGGNFSTLEHPPIILMCRVARIKQESPVSTLLGAEFLRLMIPTTDPSHDMHAVAGLCIDDLLWTDVLEETPTDPFALLEGQSQSHGNSANPD
jgi:hypothetical protein